jgi:hypothetical protein
LNFFSVESSTFHPKLLLGEEERVTGGQIGKYGGWENTVMVDNEVLRFPFLWPLAPHIFRNLLRTSQ